MRLVFDLDGCVLDSKRAHYQAYLQAKASPPKDWYHVSSKFWTTEAQRRHKNSVYPRKLAELGDILPAGKILLQTGGIIMSGCSRQSLDTFLSLYPEFAASENITFMCEFSSDDKINWLNSVAEPGVYFDDWDVMVDRVRKETRWTAVKM